MYGGLGVSGLVGCPSLSTCPGRPTRECQRDRQIEMAALLGQVRGREVDRDPPGRQPEAECAERASHPLARFGDRLVGQ